MRYNGGETFQDETQPMGIQVKDAQLVSFVEWVDTSRHRLPITLFVNGVIIVGYLVSGRFFSYAMAEAIPPLFEGISVEDAREMCDDYIARGDERFPDLSDVEEEGDDRPEPDYVHMVVTGIISGGVRFTYRPEDRTVWRGKIADVNGYLLGASEEKE